MKTTALLALALLAGAAPVPAQTMKWADPLAQPSPVVRGRAWDAELAGGYRRLPARAQALVREPLWDLSLQSAGLSVAFRSNAPEIRVRYVPGSKSLAMPHMPATGVSGLDLYATDADGRRRWCEGKYAFGDTVTYVWRNLSYATSPALGYEYHLSLPLYNSVEWMEVGVPDGALFRFLPASAEKPLVVYGTSIAQGACASRPGMAWASILGRETEHPVVNLGFSGNGRLEPEMFSLLAEIDARLYIVDCLPNMTGDRVPLVRDRVVAGVRKLRERSQAPVLLVEHSGYAGAEASDAAERTYRPANAELRRALGDLRAEGVEGLYLLTKEEIGLTMDAMVEGVHPSDLGMRLYADAYLRKVREILREDASAPFAPRKQQRDPYDWAARHEQVLALNRESAPDIVLIGNSITHYWGGEPEASIVRGADSWERLFRGKAARNLGFGYDRIENALWRVHHGELDGYRARKVFLLVGTNNLDRNTDDEIADGVGRLVAAVRDRQPRARVYVCGVLPRAWAEARVARLNQVLALRLRAEEATFVDLSSAVLRPDGRVDGSLFTDGLHPNAEGYARLAGALAPWVEEE